MGTIPSSFLPPRLLWPERIYTLPEHSGYPARLNSTEELIDRHVEAGRGDRVAIHYEDQRITYRQLLGSISRLGSALRALGIGEEDRVLLRAPSIPPALVANFAVIRIGGVIVPTSPLFSRTELAHVAENTEAVALIVAAPLLEEVEKARAELGRIRQVIVIGGDVADVKSKGYIPYAELLATGTEPCAPVRRDRLAVSVLLYTSGTTGLPKGTVHVMEEALTVPDGFGKHGWRVEADDVIGGPAPLSLAAGYSTQAVIPFRFGAAASLLPRFTPEGMFEQIQKHRITVVSILPTAYRKMMQVPEASRRYDLASVRICTGGGESLGAATYRDWREMFGLEIYEGLGTTEMMYVFASSAVTRRVKPGAIGPAVPGYELRVLGEDGAPVGSGEVGSSSPAGPLARSTGEIPRSSARRCVTAGLGRATSSPSTGTATSGSCPARTTSSSRRATESGPRKWRRPSRSTPPWQTSASSASRIPFGARPRAPTWRSGRGRRRPRPCAASSSNSVGTRSPCTSCPGRSHSCRSCRGPRGPPGPGPASSCAGSSASRPGAPERDRGWIASRTASFWSPGHRPASGPRSPGSSRDRAPTSSWRPAGSPGSWSWRPRSVRPGVAPSRSRVTSRKDGALEHAVAEALQTFGRLDVAVANAGFGVVGSLERLTLDDYRRQFETNIFGVLRTAAAALPALRKSRGTLVIVGSVASHVPSAGVSAYAMSKAAVQALAGSLRGEVLDDGVGVVLVSPGYVESEFRQVDNRGMHHPDAPDSVPRWLVVPTARAARVIVRAVARRRREVVVTGHGKVAVWLARHLPAVLAFALERRGYRSRGEPGGPG